MPIKTALTKNINMASCMTFFFYCSGLVTVLYSVSSMFNRQRPACGVQVCTGGCWTRQEDTTSGVTSPG